MKVLAINKNGDITYCTVPPELRGRGRCNHIEHQLIDETPEEFINRIEQKISSETQEKANYEAKVIEQKEIDALAEQIDKIAGTKLTFDNFEEVLSSLSPEQIAEITKICFEAAPVFSLPINDENYEEENIKNKLYFANLPKYGIAGNMTSIKQMFNKVGETHTNYGIVDVQHNYKEGLTPEEYFARQFSAREAMISKSVGTAKPGYCIYENSLVEVLDENGKLTNILWKDVEVGAKFVDGSEVVELAEWQMKPCFEMKIKGYNRIIVSNDHLIYGEIYINNKLIQNLEKSRKARKNVDERDPKWICAEDIYEMFKIGAYILVSDKYNIEYIKPYKNLIPQRVRCISTSTGFYETNGFIHHNTARKLFYALSDIQVAKDCGGPHIDILHCQMPEGHICEKCARVTKGGERIKAGQLIGGLVSTNMSEALTQLSMKQMHVGSTEVTKQISGSHIIMSTLDGWSNSPIIQKMAKAQTTEEMRQILYEGLKEEYAKANIKQDDFNIQVVARKMTSYKRTPEGLRPVNPGERCDIVSMLMVGSYGNIFKASELSTGYKFFTKPGTYKIKPDAANEILR